MSASPVTWDVAPPRPAVAPVPAVETPPAAPDGWRRRPFDWAWRLNPVGRLLARLALSRAKHPSLPGHPRLALRASRLLPAFQYDADDAWALDGAPPEIVARRTEGFARLGAQLAQRAPRTIEESAALTARISDAAFVRAHRVPFPFRHLAEAHLPVGGLVDATDGPQVRDLDGNWAYDLSGSYGVNLFGHAFYRDCLEESHAATRGLGVVLGPYHPVIREVVERLCALTGHDEVSFHMSGTEAVMQAVRLARFHTGRRYVVRFPGAYHGWSDTVQAGPGNPTPVRDVLTLADLSERTLGILRTRDDIAAVLVNPIQAMHPNAGPPTDGQLVTGLRPGGVDHATYATWLRRLREVCTTRGIVLILDDVFLGFRLARGGSQEYFGVAADLVTYGKTLGGGLPVGVLCGRRALMKRFTEGKAADLCFARGTFNAHPAVLTAMAAFLRRLDTPAVQATYAGLVARWDARAATLNARLEAAGLPIRIRHLVSVWGIHFTQPGRYHWLLQYYLRVNGLALGWIGTGRCILSHDLTDDDLTAIGDRMVAAGRAMAADGWFWRDPAVSDAEVLRLTRRQLRRRAWQAWRDRPRASSGR